MDEIALLVKRTVSEIEGGKRGRESRTRGMWRSRRIMQVVVLDPRLIGLQRSGICLVWNRGLSRDCRYENILCGN